MRAIIDTNLFVSALMSDVGPPSEVLAHWRRGAFDLLSSNDQIEEIRLASRYERIRIRTKPRDFGRLIKQIRARAHLVDFSTVPDVSRDPFDNYLLAMSQSGDADFLVSGYKADLLALGKYGRTAIVTARQFLEIVG